MACFAIVLHFTWQRFSYCDPDIFLLLQAELLNSCIIIFRDHIDILVDELIENTKKLIKVTSKEIDKWRRG